MTTCLIGTTRGVGMDEHAVAGCPVVGCPTIGRAELINRLSTVAFRLAAAASLAQGAAVSRLHSAISDLDALIAEVRRDTP